MTVPSPLTLLLFSALAFSLGHLGAQDDIRVLGYLEPYREIEMSTPETGRISEISVAEGSKVSAGQQLVSLDISVLEAQLEIAKVQAESTAAVTVATADLEVTKSRYYKLSKLSSRGTAQSLEVARAQADFKKAEGQLSIAMEEKRIAEFRVQEIEAQIERRVLRTPIDGVVLEINRDVAELASQTSGRESKPLLKIAQIEKLKLVIHVPASVAGKIAVGREMPVSVLRESSLSLDRSATAANTVGVVEFVSPAIDPSSETLRCRLMIDNSDGLLQSGSHALVAFSASGDY